MFPDSILKTPWVWSNARAVGPGRWFLFPCRVMVHFMGMNRHIKAWSGVCVDTVKYPYSTVKQVQKTDPTTFMHECSCIVTHLFSVSTFCFGSGGDACVEMKAGPFSVSVIPFCLFARYRRHGWWSLYRQKNEKMSCPTFRVVTTRPSFDFY
jgi:hypothetical protein